MSWHPETVRACSMSDFSTAYRGWLKGKGIDPDEGDRPTLDDLDELLEMYPDGR